MCTHGDTHMQSIKVLLGLRGSSWQSSHLVQVMYQSNYTHTCRAHMIHLSDEVYHRAQEHDSFFPPSHPTSLACHLSVFHTHQAHLLQQCNDFNLRWESYTNNTHTNRDQVKLDLLWLCCVFSPPLVHIHTTRIFISNMGIITPCFSLIGHRCWLQMSENETH